MQPFFHQGDVLLKRCGVKGIFEREFESIPKEATPLKTNLVLKGEMNSHALYGGKFEILEHESQKFIRIIEPSTLDHVKDLVSMERAEHHSQVIEPGDYFVDQVNEYDHLKEESRKIID